MATIKTSGLNSRYGYDSAWDLNDFLYGEAFSAASSAASLLSFGIGNLSSDLLPALATISVAMDGKSATSEDLTLTGKNLGALQTGKGVATINTLTAGLEDAVLKLAGTIQVTSKGVSGTVTSASLFTEGSHCDSNNDTLVSFVGRAVIKNNLLISQSFTSATITTYANTELTNPASENIIDSVTVTGSFSVGQNGVDGNVSGISFIGEGEAQLVVTNIQGVKLSDILEDGFNKEFILAGADTITAVYTNMNENDYDDEDFGAVIEGFGGSDTLNGGDRDDDLFGGADNDTLRGNAGEDYLDGGKGADRMFGGAGDDYYELDNAKDLVSEASNGGNDSVYLEFSESFNNYKMASGVENAFVYYAQAEKEDGPQAVAAKDSGYEVVAGTVTGNSLDNLIIGNIGNDTLNGDSGNDLLDGGDYYFSGEDEVNSSIDTLNGGKGNDVLYGGGGINVLTGGADADLFVFEPYYDDDASNRITDFKSGTDKLVLELDGYGGSFDYVDSLSTTGGPLATGNALFDGDERDSAQIFALDGEDFHAVADFESLEGFSESGVYYDTGDKKVWYVEVGEDYGSYSASSISGGSGIAEFNTYLLATLDGNVALKATDIAILDYHYYT
ncbi:MAG: hypothetical protein AABY68_10420 [Pseudomonadota bacterium]